MEEKSVNSRKQSQIKNADTKQYHELDIWIPEVQLCFEFQVWCLKFTSFKLIYLQDPYHYVTTWYSHNSIDNIKTGDCIFTNSYFILKSYFKKAQHNKKF